MERAIWWKSSRYQSEIKKTEEVRKRGSYRAEAIHFQRLQKEQNDGCYISIDGQGCLHEGAAKGDDQGWEQGLTFVQTLSPSQNSEGWIVFGFILQAWLVMWYSPVTLWSRGTLSLFSCRASSELPILLQPSFLQKMGLSPGKLNSHFTL